MPMPMETRSRLNCQRVTGTGCSWRNRGVRRWRAEKTRVAGQSLSTFGRVYNWPLTRCPGDGRFRGDWSVMEQTIGMAPGDAEGGVGPTKGPNSNRKLAGAAATGRTIGSSTPCQQVIVTIREHMQAMPRCFGHRTRQRTSVVSNLESFRIQNSENPRFQDLRVFRPLHQGPPIIQPRPILTRKCSRTRRGGTGSRRSPRSRRG